jgi:hypothetical protein
MPKGDRKTTFRGRAAFTTIAMVMGLGVPAVASTDSAVPWTSFSESTTCGVPYVATPLMSRIGPQGDGERILGPLGRYLGRTVGEVRGALVDWVVPMSGGRRVRVHRTSLPAFEQVSANLAAAAGRGLWYSVSSAHAFVPRTIGGEYQLSRHALGISIDINAARNPYSSDPENLVTDMPRWYIQAWRDAGFCWGGDWQFSKDPMHFTWMGPAPGSGGLPPLTPLGATAPYVPNDTFSTGWGQLAGSAPMAIADMTGSGAADLVRLRDHPNGLVVEALSARSGFGRCSMSRWMVDGLALGDGLVVLGDVDGDSRVDLVSVSPDGRLSVSRRQSEFEPPVTRSAPAPAGVSSALIADHDGDRRGDLHLVGSGGALTILAGPEFTTVLSTTTLPAGFTRLAAGDRNGDGSIELFAFDETGAVSILDRGAGFTIIDTASVDLQGVVAIAATDLDGDHRADLAVLNGDGRLRIWVGNTPTGRPTSAWWADPGYECPDDTIPLEYGGVFFDDDATGYEYAIERIAAAGVTTGCNPPFGDAFCPSRSVTRAEMASFLARALALPATEMSPFGDDDGSIHEPDIARLAAAGVTQGCGPGRFCPAAAVTRGEMAAFLVRAGSLPAVESTDTFTDIDGHPFAAEIAALAAAGITQGCGEGRFCPHAAVTRAEMAVFLTRLLGL